MTFPSVNRIMSERGLDLQTAPDADLRDVLYAAFEADLPLGLKCITDDIAAHKKTGELNVVTRDPNSPEGKQVARLLGADIPRSILEEKFDVKLGFYNCCTDVVGNEEQMKMSARDQIRYQDPTLANC